MGYQALLFCPDEKTARAVSQVLSELDFSVEPCTEPFGAVKKLMAHRFDAVVVDCDNEQNATLLFKSARNSNSNQSSLAVAVVEGQAGVAKAFRIGANLVLTKPMNIEQAKGTLRVARGLLRKGSEAAKSTVGPAGSTAGASTPSAPLATPRPAAPRPTGQARGVPAKLPKAPVAPSVAPPSLKSEVLDVEPSIEAGQPATSIPAPGVRQPSPSATPGSVKPNFPWQPVAKTPAEPMGSATRKAAAPTKDAPPAATKATPGVAPAVGSRRSSVPVASGMAAAAPAPAKESVTPAEVEAPAPAPPPQSPRPAVDTAPEADTGNAIAHPLSTKSVVTPDLEPPSFSLGSQDWDEEEKGGNKKALAIVAAVVLLAASAAYLGWRNSNKHPSQPTAAQAASPATESPASNATNPKPEQPAPSPQVEPIAAPPSASAKPSPVSVSAPHTSTSNKVPAKESAPTPQTPPAPEPEPAPQPLVVKRDTQHQTAPQTSQSSDPAPPPSTLAVANSDTRELANLSSAPVGVPRPSPQVLKISQGVSEGLVLKKVAPKYPAQAIQLRIQGAVQMQATISKEGNITNVKVLTGDSLLSRAAQDAVKQWKYKPYYLNGEPVEIQTLITVNFKLPN